MIHYTKKKSLTLVFFFFLSRKELQLTNPRLRQLLKETYTTQRYFFSADQLAILSRLLISLFPSCDGPAIAMNAKDCCIESLGQNVHGVAIMLISKQRAIAMLRMTQLSYEG